MVHGWTDRRSKGSGGGLGIGIVMIVAIAISIAAWIISSKMEAEAYNRVTGENVSTWDAMWIELRVQSPPKKGDGK